MLIVSQICNSLAIPQIIATVCKQILQNKQSFFILIASATKRSVEVAVKPTSTCNVSAFNVL